MGGGYGDQSWLEAEMGRITTAPFGVGFITWSLARQPELLDFVLEARPKAVMLSFGDPAPFADRIKRSGAKLICQVQTVALAIEALRSGADMIVAQGTEGGGHGGFSSTMTMVPRVVDALKGAVPVVAAGGIADGRGVAAAMMLGAEGVLIGTRFYASTEAAAPPAAKARIVASSGDDTERGIIFDIARNNVWPAPFAGRVIANGFLTQWRGRERELMQNVASEHRRYVDARTSEDFDIAAVIAGEASGMIHDLQPASKIVRSMASDAVRLLAGRHVQHQDLK